MAGLEHLVEGDVAGTRYGNAVSVLVALRVELVRLRVRGEQAKAGVREVAKVRVRDDRANGAEPGVDGAVALTGAEPRPRGLRRFVLLEGVHDAREGLGGLRERAVVVELAHAPEHVRDLIGE